MSDQQIPLHEDKATLYVGKKSSFQNELDLVFGGEDECLEKNKTKPTNVLELKRRMHSTCSSSCGLATVVFILATSQARWNLWQTTALFPMGLPWMPWGESFMKLQERIRKTVPHVRDLR